MSTFLDLYSRFLDALGGESRSEAEDLITKMCGSPSDSEDHKGARRSLVRLVKSKAPNLIPSAWLTSPEVEDGIFPRSPEDDLQLRKDAKTALEEDGVFFWGRVPEWDEIEKHYGLKGWPPAPGPDRRGQKSPKHTHHQEPHGTGVGQRNKVTTLAATIGLPELNRRLDLPEDTPLRDVVRTEQAGGPDKGTVDRAWSQQFPDGAPAADEAAEGTGEAGENKKLSATGDSRQSAHVTGRRASQVIEQLDAGEVHGLLGEDGELTDEVESLQKHLDKLRGYGRTQDVVRYMDKLAAARSRAQGDETRAWNDLQAGRISQEEYLERSEDLRQIFIDYIAAEDVLASLVEGDHTAAQAVNPELLKRWAHGVDKSIYSLAQMMGERQRERAPGARGVTSTEEADAARGEKPERRRPVPTPPTGEPAEEQREEEVAPPPRRLAPAAARPKAPAARPKAPAARGARLPETAAPAARLPETPRTTTPPAEKPEAPISDEAAKQKLDSVYDLLDQEIAWDRLTPNKQQQLLQYVREHSGDSTEELAEALLDLPGLGDKWRARGAAPEPEAEVKPEPPKPAPKPKEAPPRKPGQMPAFLQNVPQRTRSADSGEVRTSYLPDKEPGVGGRPKSKALGQLTDEASRLRRELQGMIKDEKRTPKGMDPEAALQRLDDLMDSIAASYKRKDTKAIVSAVQAYQQATGQRVGSGNFYKTLERLFGQEFGVKKAGRLPLAQELPTRLPVPEEPLTRLPV